MTTRTAVVEDELSNAQRAVTANKNMTTVIIGVPKQMGISSFSRTSPLSLCHDHRGEVVFNYRSRIQKNTRLCPYCCGSILGPSYSRQFPLHPRDTPPFTLHSHIRVFSSPESPLA